MTNCPSRFADKHFANADERNALWRTLNSKEDIDMYIALAETHAGRLSQGGKALPSVDLIKIETDLAKLEIAIQRVADFNEVLFGYKDEEKAQMQHTYNQLANLISIL